MFLKINEYTINTDQIRFIVHDQRGSISINFGSAGNLVLDAEEAVDFLRKLHTEDTPTI
jgi:hypothetical protein